MDYAKQEANCLTFAIS